LATEPFWIGRDELAIHNGGVQFRMTGGVIEIAAGLMENGGINGNGSAIWANNLASLQIDSGAAYDTWMATSPWWMRCLLGHCDQIGLRHRGKHRHYWREQWIRDFRWNDHERFGIDQI